MSIGKFRLGTTSYIFPDTLVSNVRRLKDQVEDIEFILFELDSKDNYPSLSELKEMKKIKRDYDLTYTIHMPLDISLGSEINNKRRCSIDKLISLMDYLAVLKPHSFILHFNLSERAGKNIKLWQTRINDSLSHILEKTTTVSTKIAVENLDYPFSCVEDIVTENNLSICMDIGHLIVAGIDVERHMTRYLDRTRVIHFHGVNKKKDHLSLKYLDKRLIRSILQFLKNNNYHEVLTLEVFSQRDLEESMDVLEV